MMARDFPDDMHARQPVNRQAARAVYPVDRTGEVEVELKRGKHSAGSVPKGIDKLVIEVLEACQVAGQYVLLVGWRIKGTAHTPKFRAVSWSDRGVELVLKPGDNNTATTCWLTPKNAAALSCEQLFGVLAPPDPKPADEDPAVPEPSIAKVVKLEPAKPRKVRTPPPPTSAVDLDALIRQLAAQEDNLALAALQAEERMTAREAELARLREEVAKLGEQRRALDDELRAVSERLAATRMVVAMVEGGNQ